MSDEFPSESETPFGIKLDAFIPLIILSISIIVLLGWQVSVSSAQRNLLENAITRQEAAVTQSQQVQTGVSKLANDLLQAAQTDDVAKQIVAKFKIQQAEPAASPTGP